MRTKCTHESTFTKSMSEQIIIKWMTTSNKENYLQQLDEKSHITCKEPKMRMTVDFSSETMHVKKQKNNIFKVLKVEKYLEFLPEKMYFKNKSELNFFSAKHCVRIYCNMPSLQEMWKEFLIIPEGNLDVHTGMKENFLYFKIPIKSN